jgi:hypothetical protein
MCRPRSYVGSTSSRAGRWVSAAGVTTEEVLNSPDNKVIPDYVLPKLPDLLTVKELAMVAA